MWSTLWNSFVKSVIVAGLFLSIGNIEVRASNLSFRSENIGEILKIIGLPQSQTTLTGKYGFCVLPREDAVNFLTQKTDYIESPDIYGNRRADVCYRLGDKSLYHFEQRTTSSGQKVPMLTIEELYMHLLTVDLEKVVYSIFLPPSISIFFTADSTIDSLSGNPNEPPRGEVSNTITAIVRALKKEEKYTVHIDDQVDQEKFALVDAGESAPLQGFLMRLKPTDNFETLMARQPFKDFCAPRDGSISCFLEIPPSNGLCTDQMIEKLFLGCFGGNVLTLIRTQKQDPSMTSTQKQDPSMTSTQKQDPSMTNFGTWLVVILIFVAIIGAIWFAYFYK
eukprot:692427_1